VNEGEAVPALAAPPSRNLLVRILAAAVLVPLTLGAAYAGGVLWTALVTLAIVGLYVEWLMVAGAARERRIVATGVVALALTGLSLLLSRMDAALLLCVFGLVSVIFISAERRGWVVAGFVYAAVPLFAAVLLRADLQLGFIALIFVLLIVWTTDIGAYFAGRGLGGPKLWPRVSPNKTWAGAIGGFVASLLVAAGFTASGESRMLPLLIVGGALSIAGQLGDLFESAVKRHFGVKDSSHLIPGHGGLMDRLDSLIAAIALAAILGILRGGVDGAGRGLMVW
jgi:phosphatidate cytidylyltransferase